MRAQRWTVAGICVAITLAISAFVFAAEQLPMEPAHDSGQSITGALEGWFKNPDGTFTILLGYYNRNLKQGIEIPVGPDNKIEPGGPDYGQPTHFLPGRMWGVLSVVVPKDFGDKKLTWTITANHKTTVIPFSLNTLWEISPFIEASGNTPPFLKFDESGNWIQGPPKGIAKELTATVGTPLTLNAWVADDVKGAGAAALRMRGAPVTLSWSKYRGPGTVTFAKEKPPVEKAEMQAPPTTTFAGKGTTTATFSASGEYILEALSNDLSGEGGRGFQCCWSTVQVKVTVK
jgi:hypothetical protein